MAATSSPQRPLVAPQPVAGRIVRLGLAIYGAFSVALGLFMVVAPHAFFARIGPFGARNVHYIRDNATFNLALGAALAIAVRHPRWRVPVLAVATIQATVHAVNHLADIGKAHPRWTGPFDFALLAASALALGWLLRRAAREERSL